MCLHSIYCKYFCEKAMQQAGIRDCSNESGKFWDNESSVEFQVLRHILNIGQCFCSSQFGHKWIGELPCIIVHLE